MSTDCELAVGGQPCGQAVCMPTAWPQGWPPAANSQSNTTNYTTNNINTTLYSKTFQPNNNVNYISTIHFKTYYSKYILHYRKLPVVRHVHARKRNDDPYAHGHSTTPVLTTSR